MGNLEAFLGYFLSYGILFIVFVLIAAVGCCIGINIRKSKNAKEGYSEAAGSTEA